MELERVRDIPYGQIGERTLALDLLLPPPPRNTLLPAVVWLHGGGWYSGNKRGVLTNGMLDDLPRAGFALASVDYRLAGEATFPAPIHDVKAALRFLHAHGASLGIDPERIAIAGFSAGGHLAALAATSAGVSELEGVAGLPGHPPRVAAAIVLASPTDFLQNPRATDPAQNPLAAAGVPCGEHMLLGGPVLERVEGARMANPLRYIRPGMPPFLIVQGAADEIVPLSQAELLYEALRAAGADATLVVVEDGNHGFWEAGKPYPKEPMPPAIRRWMVQFLASHLRGEAGFPLRERHTVRVAKLRETMSDNHPG
jgi:acetyl esterase/lipase